MLILGDEISGRNKAIFLALGVSFMVINSAILGGRSGILFGLAFWSYTFFLSQAREKVSIFRDKNLFKKMFLGLLLIGYVLYVFFDRARANGIDVALYGENFLPYLGFVLVGVPDYESFWSDLWVIINLAASYITHSIASVAAIIQSSTTTGTAWGNHFVSIAYKLGFLDNLPNDWMLRGRFPSLPGAFLYAGGPVYMICLSIFLGIVSGFLIAICSLRRSILSILCGSSIEAVLLMSPLVFALDILFFPFCIVGGLLMVSLSKITRNGLSTFARPPRS